MKEESAYIEWFAGTLRGGPGCTKNPAPYKYSCTIVRIGNVVWIMGLSINGSGKFTIAMFKAMEDTMQKEGIEEVRWERKNNESREVIWKVRKR